MIAAVAPGLYRLPGVNQGVNSYLWLPRGTQGSAGSSMLFDCGWPWSGPGLVASLQALDCRPEALRGIAITHDDIDHTGRLASLYAVSGAAVYAHVLERDRLAQEQWRELPGGLGLGTGVEAISYLMYRRYLHHPVPVSHPLEDGDELVDGWQAVHTPGHTPGHTSYFHPELKVLIAGDALGRFNGRRLRYPMPVYCEDRQAVLASVRKLSTLRPNIICFGHGAVMHEAAEPLERLAESLPH